MRICDSGTFLLALSAGLLLGGPATLAWQKAFSDWTPQDAQRLMTDSPWSKQIPMPSAARPGITVLEPGANGQPTPTASLGNPANSTSSANVAVVGTPPNGGSGESVPSRSSSNAPSPSTVSPLAPAPDPHLALNIIWASAVPVRLAVLKLQSGVNVPTSGEIERVSKPRENYVIAIAGLAPPDSDTDLDRLAAKASLSVKGKPAATATSCNYRKIGNADVYFFRFPKTNLPITSDDHQVEFKATFGQAEIKHKFELKNMLYQGQLAL